MVESLNRGTLVVIAVISKKYGFIVRKVKICTAFLRSINKNAILIDLDEAAYRLRKSI